MNRRKVESRKGFPGGEAREMENVGIQETRNQDIRVRTGPGGRWNVKGSPQSSQARQIWLKIDRKTKAVRLGRGNRRGHGREGEEMDEGGERTGSVCHLLGKEIALGGFGRVGRWKDSRDHGGKEREEWVRRKVGKIPRSLRVSRHRE